MSYECSECGRDARGEHDEECSRHHTKVIVNLRTQLKHETDRANINAELYVKLRVDIGEMALVVEQQEHNLIKERERANKAEREVALYHGRLRTLELAGAEVDKVISKQLANEKERADAAEEEKQFLKKERDSYCSQAITHGITIIKLEEQLAKETERSKYGSCRKNNL